MPLAVSPLARAGPLQAVPGSSLAHNLVQLRGPHPGILHLLERSSRIDAFMLGGVSDHHYSVLGFDLSRKARICLVLAKLDSSSM